MFFEADTEVAETTSYDDEFQTLASTMLTCRRIYSAVRHGWSTFLVQPRLDATSSA